MSKSLGNSPDALKLIEDFGADGVRVGLLLSSAAGNDLLFDQALCHQGKAFGNKIWNAFRLIEGWEVRDIEQPDYAAIAIDWYAAKFQKVLAEIEDHFSKFRLSDALMAIYKLIWDDFCSWCSQNFRCSNIRCQRTWFAITAAMITVLITPQSCQLLRGYGAVCISLGQVILQQVHKLVVALQYVKSFWK